MGVTSMDQGQQLRRLVIAVRWSAFACVLFLASSQPAAFLSLQRNSELTLAVLVCNIVWTLLLRPPAPWCRQGVLVPLFIVDALVCSYLLLLRTPVRNHFLIHSFTPPLTAGILSGPWGGLAVALLQSVLIHAIAPLVPMPAPYIGISAGRLNELMGIMILHHLVGLSAGALNRLTRQSGKSSWQVDDNSFLSKQSCGNLWGIARDGGAITPLDPPGTLASARTKLLVAHGDLTVRECEILEFIIAGLTNKEIAESLNITHETVKKHVYHLYQKLRVSSRRQAIREGLRLLTDGTDPDERRGTPERGRT